MQRYALAIVGGGAAGLLAGVRAGERMPGQRVVVLEANQRVGRKLLATGTADAIWKICRRRLPAILETAGLRRRFWRCIRRDVCWPIFKASALCAAPLRMAVCIRIPIRPPRFSISCASGWPSAMSKSAAGFPCAASTGGERDTF